MRAVTIGLLALLMLSPVGVRADDDSSPHHMTKSDGSLDMQKCAVCHNEDMSLQRAKLETCTLCHAQTSHAGSDEHVRAAPAAVKAALAGQPKGGPTLPLTDDGHIFCGTCHIFHDPKVMEEAWLSRGWVPPDSGMSAAVRQGVLDRWAKLALKADDKSALGSFADKGTRQLRLPVDAGQLCAQCHGALQ